MLSRNILLVEHDYADLSACSDHSGACTFVSGADNNPAALCISRCAIETTVRDTNIARSVSFLYKKIRAGLMSNNVLLVGVAVAAGLLIAAISLSISNSAAQPESMNQGLQGQAQMNMDEREKSEKTSVQFALNRKYMDYEDGVFRVRVGAGNHIAPLTLFFPNHAEIKVGETVVFYNPTRVSEPHTVTFIIDNGTFADFAAPYVLENETAITPLPPNANAEPIMMPGPGGKNVIVALNNRSFSPTVIDSSGNATYLPLNANYTMTGTEKYLNSGWIWPKGLSPPGLAPIDSFSVTFEKEGTYNYMCVVHPWMSGDVVVK